MAKYVNNYNTVYCYAGIILSSITKGYAAKVVTDDLEKSGLDIEAKDRERWKARFMGKTFDLCEHGQGK